ncbi:hypothetical protein [Streptococcus sobrinus]|uniref:hypothetical protein n=1 Tax=Streptococcus sobrinus TaxID=1310 RepID=UPI000375DB64|nr:hypothetical protein [Streptococcus sobrinus]
MKVLILNQYKPTAAQTDEPLYNKVPPEKVDTLKNKKEEAQTRLNHFSEIMKKKSLFRMTIV